MRNNIETIPFFGACEISYIQTPLPLQRSTVNGYGEILFNPGETKNDLEGRERELWTKSESVRREWDSMTYAGVHELMFQTLEAMDTMYDLASIPHLQREAHHFNVFSLLTKSGEFCNWNPERFEEVTHAQVNMNQLVRQVKTMLGLFEEHQHEGLQEAERRLKTSFYKTLPKLVLTKERKDHKECYLFRAFTENGTLNVNSKEVVGDLVGRWEGSIKKINA